MAKAEKNNALWMQFYSFMWLWIHICGKNKYVILPEKNDSAL